MLVIVVTGPFHRCAVEVPLRSRRAARHAAFHHAMRRPPTCMDELLVCTQVPAVEVLTNEAAELLLPGPPPPTTTEDPC